MAIVKLNGEYLDIDIADLLGEFEWTRARWSTDKLIAASPFRYDHTPSFFVNLQTGGWHDSGAYDADYESGNLAKLLAFLRDETYEETCDYLAGLYGNRAAGNDGNITLPKISLQSEKKQGKLEEDILNYYNFRHSYLTNRGISEKVQRFMGIGYSRQARAITMPWRHADSSLANVKYRKVQGKAFWYERGGAHVRTLVYGIDKVYRHDLREVIVCEAEIDALSWYVAGKPAIALGGTAVTTTQLDLIRKSPIDTLVLAMDNDKAGDKMRQHLAKGLRGYLTLKSVKIPAEYKDANEALTAGVDLSILVVDDFYDIFDWNVQK